MPVAKERVDLLGMLLAPLNSRNITRVCPVFAVMHCFQNLGSNSNAWSDVRIYLDREAARRVFFSSQTGKARSKKQRLTQRVRAGICLLTVALTSSHNLNIRQSKARVHLHAEHLRFTVIHEIGLHQHTEAAVADGLLQITTNQT